MPASLEQGYWEGAPGEGYAFLMLQMLSKSAVALACHPDVRSLEAHFALGQVTAALAKSQDLAAALVFVRELDAHEREVIT